MTNVSTIPADSASDMLVLNLIRNSDGAVFAKNVELVTPRAHTRINLKGEPTLSEAFSTVFLQQLERLVAQATDSKMLLLADHVIDLGDLVLRGCRVMLSAARHGFEYVMIRFKSFSGRLNTLFTREFALPEGEGTRTPAMNTALMEEIFMPLFNFAEHIDGLARTAPLTEAEAQSLGRVRAEIDKLRYSYDLMGYALARDDVIADHAAPTVAHLTGTLAGPSAAGDVIDATADPVIIETPRKFGTG